MKTFIYLLMAASAALVIFNATKLDFGNLFAGDSGVASISILAGLCAILLLGILLISKAIAARSRK